MACVGIIYNPKTHTQRFYRDHDDDISSLALHPDGVLVATGQCTGAGKSQSKAHVRVWDSKTLETKAVFGQDEFFKSTSCLAFSTTKPDILAAVDTSNDHVLSIWNWQKGVKLMETKAHKEMIFACGFNPQDNRLLTLGAKGYATFWEEKDGALDEDKGLFEKNERADAYLSMVFAPNGDAITGDSSGNIYLWAKGERTISKSVKKAHKGPIFSLEVTKDGFFSGGADDTVRRWNWDLEPVGNAVKVKGDVRCVATSEDADDTVYYIGTRENTIIKATRGTEETIISGHFDEVWGLYADATKPNVFYSTADDKTVRSWDAETRKQLWSYSLGKEEGSTVALRPSANDVAVGTNKGSFVVLDSSSGKQIAKKKTSKERISTVRFSPDGSLLAVASHDNLIDLYDATQKYKKVATCKGHSSFVRQIDFSSDGKFLQSASGDYELLFWNTSDGQQVFARNLGNIKWDTFTSTLGWEVQGIWEDGADGTDVNAVARSNNQKLLATADDYGAVNLYSYPCYQNEAPHRKFPGHSSHVTNVWFSADDSRIFSTGGRDHGVFQWKLSNNVDDSKEESKPVPKAEAIVIEDKPAKTEKPELTEKKSEMKEEREDGVRYEIQGRFLTVYPPLGFKPSDGDNQKPAEELELEFVQGYQGNRGRNNLQVLPSGELVYFMACVGIVYNPETNTQRFYRGHDDDISSLALHTDGVLVATGQCTGAGKSQSKAHVCVWDSSTLETKATFGEGVFYKSTSCLAFAVHNPDLLAAVDTSNDHVISIWNWQKGVKLTETKGHGDMIYACAFNPVDQRLVTVGGKGYVNFWTFKDDNTLDDEKGLFDKHERADAYLSVVFSPEGDTITGDSAGNIYKWPKGERNISKSVKDAHKGAIFHLEQNDGGFFTGSRDDSVKEWTWDLDQVGDTIKVNGDVRCVATPAGKAKVYYIGTRKNAIIKVSGGKEETIIEGHFDEVWGLCADPKKPNIYYSTADDKTVRAWDAETRKQLWSYSLEEEKGQTVAVSPTNTHIAIGSDDGKYIILDSTSGKEVVKRKTSKERISTVRYSPDGKVLAIASHDNLIDLYEVSNNYKKFATCKGHTSFVRQVDFSSDGRYIQTASGDYELLFWDTSNGEQVFARDLGDVTWQTHTCTLGWPVQGIWEDGADGSDVNAVARSNNQKLLATADDYGAVNLYSYPCYQNEAPHGKFPGHSSHVTNVWFSADDTRIFSTGGRDHGVFQWKVKRS
eukprot:m.201004 g.201004  ORF g.201004 m.201004 type:complete len:1228 (-) comp25954_c0_seq3:39-3722(-)